MTVVIGRLNPSRNGMAAWDKIRKIQVEVAAEDPLAWWVDTDDLPRSSEYGGIHFTQQGYTKLANRFAETAIALIRGQRGEMAKASTGTADPTKP
jgi:hypothetical protein